MSSFRVASLDSTARSRAFVILSNWAARYAKRRSISTRYGSSPLELIATNNARQLDAREEMFLRNLPFSWVRCFAGLVSLGLVFSDIFRGGVGVSSMQPTYPALQPDEGLGFGSSWNYSVFSATRTEAADAKLTALVWTYKFDSTSISWRAFGGFLAVEEFPDCFLYLGQCPNETVSGTVVFNMVDSLVNVVARINSTHKTGQVALTLRTENEYIDRLHQFLLPAWFTNINWRTNQVLHYSTELLQKTNAARICFPAIGSRMRKPSFCTKLWSNYRRACVSTDGSGQAVGLLAIHIMDRVHEVQNRFPNLTVDLTVLESQEDMQVCQGGLSSLGFRRSDVSTIIRARNCTSSGVSRSCETVFIDEYRYETALLTSDIVQWYRLVAGLRLLGQSYFWLRGVGLMLSCYFVYGPLTLENNAQTWIRLRKARSLFMKVPTQCVVYGNLFPVLCYVLAHLLDAPFTYQVLESHFFSQAGVVDIKLESFISFAVVQMRSVWIYVLVWHIVVSALTSRGLTKGNGPSSGVIGVPELILSAFSSITLLAQYRMSAIRSAKILTVMEVPSNFSHAWGAVKYQYSFARRGRGNRSLGGVLIDLKFLICFLFLVGAVYITHACWIFYLTRTQKERKTRYPHWVLFPSTPVPYSADCLWSTRSVCVHWTSDFYCIRDEQQQEPELYNIVKKKQQRHRYPYKSRLMWWKYGDARVCASIHNSPSNYLAATRKTDVFRYIQHQLECLHARSDQVEANVAFMNVVLLSDPIFFVRVMLDSTELAYYQSIWRPKQIVLLPVLVVGEHNEYTSGLKLLRRVKASELSWAELVQCG